MKIVKSLNVFTDGSTKIVYKPVFLSKHKVEFQKEDFNSFFLNQKFSAKKVSISKEIINYRKGFFQSD